MKIFLVDDSSFINLVCRKALESEGYEIVGEAYDGEQAVEAIIAAQPDIVLMDIALPKKNGLEATAEVMAVIPQLKVIAVSGLEDDWVQEKATEAGCVLFLKKPFSAEDLSEAVRQVAGESGELKYG